MWKFRAGYSLYILITLKRMPWSKIAASFQKSCKTAATLIVFKFKADSYVDTYVSFSAQPLTSQGNLSLNLCPIRCCSNIYALIRQGKFSKFCLSFKTLIQAKHQIRNPAWLWLLKYKYGQGRLWCHVSGSPNRYFKLSKCGNARGVYIISDPIEAWKWNFPTILEIMTDRPTDRPIDQPTDGQKKFHFQFLKKAGIQSISFDVLHNNCWFCQLLQFWY